LAAFACFLLTLSRQFVGAGGNTIAAIIQWIFFTNTQMIVPRSLVNLGITMCVGFHSLTKACR
jgi:hypothetical protein